MPPCRRTETTTALQFSSLAHREARQSNCPDTPLPSKSSREKHTVSGPETSSDWAMPTAAETGVTFTLEESGEDLRILAHGKGAHASLPEDGNNGITALLHLLALLPLAPCESTVSFAHWRVNLGL